MAGVTAFYKHTCMFNAIKLCYVMLCYVMLCYIKAAIAASVKTYIVIVLCIPVEHAL